MTLNAVSPTYKAVQWNGVSVTGIESFVEVCAGYVDLEWTEDTDPESAQLGWLSCNTNTPVKLRINIPPLGYLVYGPLFGTFLDWTTQESNGFRAYTASEFSQKFVIV